jgi:hypothetical protein
MGFWAFHVDTLGWSVALGLIFVHLPHGGQEGDFRSARRPAELR